MLGKLRAHIHVHREQNKGEYNWRGSSYKSAYSEMKHFFYAGTPMLRNCTPPRAFELSQHVMPTIRDALELVFHALTSLIIHNTFKQ